MLKVDRTNGKLLCLSSESLSKSGITERSDLQELIFQNADEFFRQECGEDLFVLAQEVSPSLRVTDRIDLLAIDTLGRIVVIELKRGSHRLQLLQAISYAAMVAAEMSGKQITGSLVSGRKRAELDRFLSENEIDLDGANLRQRIILIAEQYDYEVLQTAVWLTESHGLNIVCYEVALAQDESSQTEYLSAVQLYPPKTLAEQARQRGAVRAQEETRFPTLEERLSESPNPAVKEFFEDWLAAKPRRNRRMDAIVLPRTGKMRFRFTPRRGYVRVVQLGRFNGDEAKWSLIAPGTVKCKTNRLNFRLSTRNGLLAFKEFAEKELDRTQWIAGADPDSDEDEPG